MKTYPDEEPTEDDSEERESEEDKSMDEDYPEEDELIDDYPEEDEAIDSPKLEFSEARGGIWYHLRHRDNKGRFATPFKDPEHELERKIDKRIDEIVKRYRKKIALSYNVKILLLRLVDDFNERKHFYKRGLEDRAYFPLSQFKRIPYHKVFVALPLKRSAFSIFISKMIKEGLVVKIKHGHKLYLRITKKGLDKVYAFWEEYPGESWRRP